MALASHNNKIVHFLKTSFLRARACVDVNLLQPHSLLDTSLFFFFRNLEKKCIFKLINLQFMSIKYNSRFLSVIGEFLKRNFTCGHFLLLYLM